MDTILWRFIVYPGHEYCQLFSENSAWHLQGVAVFSHEHRPCRLNYHVQCDASWHTRLATVDGWVGQTKINIHIRTEDSRRWWLNQAEVPEVAGCSDVDLNFSPSTNTIPIRRLNLAVGEAATIKAAWLRFPGFNLEPLEQRYTRLEQHVYHYESGGGGFVADLRVNQAGLVHDYPGVWQAEAPREENRDEKGNRDA